MTFAERESRGDVKRKSGKANGSEKRVRQGFGLVTARRAWSESMSFVRQQAACYRSCVAQTHRDRRVVTREKVGLVD